MLVRHFAQGKWYAIACPEGSRIVRGTPGDGLGERPSPDRLIVPRDGREVTYPAEPEGLLPLLAESGQFGIALAAGPEPGPELAGVSCPHCGDADLEWLSLRDDGRVVCERCWAEFPVQAGDPFALDSVADD